MNCSWPAGSSGGRCVTRDAASVRVATMRASGGESRGGRRDPVMCLTASACCNSRATAWKGIWLVCDSHKVVNTSILRADAIAESSRTRRLFPTRRPDDAHHSALTIDRTVQQALNGGHLPAPTNQSRLRTPDARMPFAYAQQAMGGHRFLGALDPNHLRFTENRHPVHQPRGGRAEHHPTRRSDRLHPLSHPHLLTHGGVTERPRPDLPGDHLTGVEANAQPKIQTVALADPGGSRFASS